ncbi:hypothetical protein Tco_1366839 [Tanacetum coccineum]
MSKAAPTKKIDNEALLAIDCPSRYADQQFRFHGFSHEREKKRVASKAHCIVFLPLQPHLVKEAVSASNQKEMTVQAVSTAEAPSCSLDLDYNEAAAVIINSDTDEDHVNQVKKVWRGRNKIPDTSDKPITKPTVNIVRSQHKKVHRLTLENRIHLKSKSDVPYSFANTKLGELLIVYLDLWFLCCSRGKVP